MEEEKQKTNKTTLIVIITVVITLIVVGIILGAWFGVGYFKKRIDELEKNTTSQTPTSTEPTATTQAVPSESASVAAENFIKSIFDTFPSSAVDLTTANKYLSAALKSQVNSTKESYWDLHGYIHSGPCSVSVAEISNNGTTAVEEITTEWGESCIGLAEPYYRYHLSAIDGQWVITQIEQLKPSDGEQVPRDF